jgi:hypothetical protein
LDSESAVVLARLMPQPKAMAAMMPHVKPGAKWLDKSIDAMRGAKVPVVYAMPLVVRALSEKALSPALAMQLLTELKANGNWLEAHAVWTAWLGHAVPLIYNGDFEDSIADAGFDWEITPVAPSKAGAVVEQIEVAGHGGVLNVEFNGRSMVTPLVKQDMVLLGDHYRITGQYLSPKLVSREGVVWSLVCLATKQEVAQT